MEKPPAVISKEVWYSATIIISGLISINAYFVKGLFDTIGDTSKKVVEIHERLAILEAKVQDLRYAVDKRNNRKGASYGKDTGERFGLKKPNKSNFGFGASFIRDNGRFLLFRNRTIDSCGTGFKSDIKRSVRNFS